MHNGDRDAGLNTDSFPADGEWHELTTPERGSAPAGYTAWLNTEPDAVGLADDLDSPLADADTEEPKDAAPLPQREKIRLRWIGVAAVTACVVLGIGVWTVLQREPTTTDAAPGNAITTPSISTDQRPPACVSVRTPQRVSGAGPGSTASGPDVVLALEAAYYVDRSAAAVRALLVSGGPFGLDSEIQAGIDAIPIGTRDCVDIIPAGPQRWSVTITEHRPAGSTVMLHQTITTTTRDGRTLVAAVEPA